jgi:hypothetical protein
MQNKRTLFKVGCGAVAASAIAAGVVFEVINNEKISQFSNNGAMTAEDYEFMSYVSTYGKNFPTKTEYKSRASNWARADDAIRKHNKMAHRTWKMAHNRLSDWSTAEKNKLLGFKADGPVTPTNINNSLTTAVPQGGTVNWVTAGKVAPVVN